MKARILRGLAIASLAGVMSAAVDPQLIGLAMPDVKFLAGVYPDRLPAALQQYFLALFPPAAATELQLFLAAPGLGPTKDIHEMLFATVDPSQTVGLAMARGVFNVGQMSDYLVSQGHTADVYNGVPLISSADGSVAIAFPDSSLALIGAPDDVTAAIMLAALANARLSSTGMLYGATVQFAVRSTMDTAENCIAQANIVRFVARAVGYGCASPSKRALRK